MSATPPDDEQSPWSRPPVLLSGAFILALILVGVIVAVTSGGGSRKNHTVAQQPPTSTTTPAGSASTSTSSSKTTSSAGCHLPAGSQAIPSTSPPAGTRWATVGSMQVPQAPGTLGPERTAGVFNTCFAHNPSGALLAALNFWAEGTATASGTVYRHLAVGAPATALKTSSRLDSSGPVQWAGYKFDSYRSTKAQVSVVLQGPKGKLLALVTPMTWVNGDWRYRFPNQGVPSVDTIPDLTGYVSWSAFS